MNLHVEKQSVYAHADGVGPPEGGRDKCGDVYKRGFGGGREATIGFAHKADIYFVADGDKMDESTTPSIAAWGFFVGVVGEILAIAIKTKSMFANIHSLPVYSICIILLQDRINQNRIFGLRIVWRHDAYFSLYF